MNLLEYYGIIGFVIYSVVGVALFQWLRRDAPLGSHWTWYVAAFIACLSWGLVVISVFTAHIIRLVWMMWKVWTER